MQNPLIVGAGPVGLAAAVFLAKQNRRLRIIDSLAAPSPYSKALAINPRTLELLEPTGVTEKLLKAGRRITELNLYMPRRAPIRITLTNLKHKYNFLLALSQAATEAILTEELTTLGINIERGRQLLHCHELGGVVKAEIQDVKTGLRETCKPEWLLGTDGAHSIVRQDLGFEFQGSSMEGKWYLADLALETSLPDDRAYMFLLDDGFLFLIPVVDHRHDKTAAPLWRIISNHQNPLEHLQHARPIGKPEWESAFHIGHRTATHFSKGNIYLAGDAAHIHSPLGARGMNLGIEDAWAFAELLRLGKLDKYAPIREKIDREVVKNIKLLTTSITGNSPLTRSLRNILMPVIMQLPFLTNRLLLRVGTGLDHEAMPQL